MIWPELGVAVIAALAAEERHRRRADARRSADREKADRERRRVTALVEELCRRLGILVPPKER